MNFKRLVTTFILTLAITHFCFGQQSAQATMKVQVTVVKGNSISSASSTSIDLKKSMTATSVSEIATMKINRRSNTAIVFNRPDKLYLIDGKGGQLSIPLIYTDKVTEGEVISTVVAKPIQEAENVKGAYKGALTTSISYL